MAALLAAVASALPLFAGRYNGSMREHHAKLCPPAGGAADWPNFHTLRFVEQLPRLRLISDKDNHQLNV